MLLKWEYEVEMKKIFICMFVMVWMACGDEPTKKAKPTSNNTANNANNSNNVNNINNVNNTNNVTPNNIDPMADDDLDGVPNGMDNCPLVANAPQTDSDMDGVGDRCDNCPMDANADQADADGDNLGDACDDSDGYDPDRDRDSDGVRDVEDTCPDVPNPSQTVDQDGDGVPDACDNCLSTPNATQQDADGDGEGDACEAEPAGRECPVALVAALKPQLHIILDNSGSMGSENRTEIQEQAFRSAADRIATNFRVSMGHFPAGLSCGGGIISELDMGDWTAADISAGLPTAPDGGSSSSDAIEDVVRENRFSDASDAQASQRAKHILLVADSESNNCTPPSDTQAAAEAVAATGAEFHAIAFDSGSDSLQSSVASANGSYKQVTTQNEFDNALSDALDLMGGGCALGLNTIPEDPTLLWLLEDGQALPRTDWSYDATSNTINLSSAACDTVSRDALSVFAGCPEPCIPSEEVCDYEDNDCDGIVDEGCE